MLFVSCFLYSYNITSKAPTLLEPLYRDLAMNVVERYSTIKPFLAYTTGRQKEVLMLLFHG